MVKPRRISDFKPTFTNLAQTSHYQLTFGGLPLGLRQHLNVRGLDYRFLTETSGLLCNRAVLPGSSNAIANIRGNYTGVVENMSHARIFTEASLEFYVDKEYKTLKFFEHWIEFIANGSGQDQSRKDYFVRMEYPDDYKTYQTKLVKFDRDYNEEMIYNFYGLFPRALNNTPVKYEGSEVLKATVLFTFDRYSVGKYSSYDRYRGRYNHLKENFKQKRKSASEKRVAEVKNNDDVFAGFDRGATNPDSLTYQSFN